MKITPDNFRKPDGSIDHEAFLEKALDEDGDMEVNVDGDDVVNSQIQIGEVCKDCLIDLNEKTGKATSCQSCRHADDDCAILHPLKIRCPRCKDLYEPEFTNDDLVDDDVYQSICPKCSTSFVVEAIIAYVSPPLMTEKK